MERSMFSYEDTLLLYIQHYAHVLAGLRDRYEDQQESQVAVLSDFDLDQGQIDHAWNTLIGHAPDTQIDGLLLDYGMATIDIGDLRYDKQNQRKQHYEAMLHAAQRRGAQYFEAVALATLASVAADLSAYQEALALYEQAQTIAQIFEKPDMIAAILGNKGSIYAEQGDYQKAIGYYEEAIALNPDADDGNYHALGNLALAYSMLGQVPAAQELYAHTLTLARRQGDLRAQASLLGNLGLLADTRGEYQQAHDFHQQALEISRKLGDNASEEKDLLHLGLALEELGLPDAAADCFQKAIVIATRIGDRRGLAYALGGQGRLLASIGDTSGARSAFERSITLAQEVGEQRALGLALMGNAKMDLSQGDSRNALQQAICAFHTLRGCGPLPEHLNALSLMTNAAFACDKHQRAYRFALSWHRLACSYGHLHAQGEALIALGGTAHAAGRTRTAYRHYLRARRLLSQLDDLQLWGLLQWNRSLLMIATGRYASAIETLRDSVESALAVGDPDAESRAAYLQEIIDTARHRSHRWRRWSRAAHLG
jgi:tetratricopeptide (TPR) repeat protein